MDFLRRKKAAPKPPAQSAARALGKSNSMLALADTGKLVQTKEKGGDGELDASNTQLIERAWKATGAPQVIELAQLVDERLAEFTDADSTALFDAALRCVFCPRHTSRAHQAHLSRDDAAAVAALFEHAGLRTGREAAAGERHAGMASDRDTVVGNARARSQFVLEESELLMQRIAAGRHRYSRDDYDDDAAFAKAQRYHVGRLTATMSAMRALPESDCQLTVEVLRGANMACKDAETGASDPYVVMFVQDKAERHTGPAVKNTLNPVWQPPVSKTFSLPSTQWAATRELRIEVWDEDYAEAGKSKVSLFGFSVNVGMDVGHALADYMGTASLPLQRVIDQQPVELELALRPDKAHPDAEVSGTVTAHVHYTCRLGPAPPLKYSTLAPTEQDAGTDHHRLLELLLLLVVRDSGHSLKLAPHWRWLFDEYVSRFAVSPFCLPLLRLQLLARSFEPRLELLSLLQELLTDVTMLTATELPMSRPEVESHRSAVQLLVGHIDACVCRYYQYAEKGTLSHLVFAMSFLSQSTRQDDIVSLLERSLQCACHDLYFTALGDKVSEEALLAATRVVVAQWTIDEVLDHEFPEALDLIKFSMEAHHGYHAGMINVWATKNRELTSRTFILLTELRDMEARMRKRDDVKARWLNLAQQFKPLVLEWIVQTLAKLRAEHSTALCKDSWQPVELQGGLTGERAHGASLEMVSTSLVQLIVNSNTLLMSFANLEFNSDLECVEKFSRAFGALFEDFGAKQLEVLLVELGFVVADEMQTLRRYVRSTRDVRSSATVTSGADSSASNTAAAGTTLASSAGAAAGAAPIDEDSAEFTQRIAAEAASEAEAMEKRRNALANHVFDGMVTMTESTCVMLDNLSCLSAHFKDRIAAAEVSTQANPTVIPDFSCWFDANDEHGTERKLLAMYERGLDKLVTRMNSAPSMTIALNLLLEDPAVLPPAKTLSDEQLAKRTGVLLGLVGKNLEQAASSMFADVFLTVMRRVWAAMVNNLDIACFPLLVGVGSSHDEADGADEKRKANRLPHLSSNEKELRARSELRASIVRASLPKFAAAFTCDGEGLPSDQVDTASEELRWGLVLFSRTTHELIEEHTEYASANSAEVHSLEHKQTNAHGESVTVVRELSKAETVARARRMARAARITSVLDARRHEDKEARHYVKRVKDETSDQLTLAAFELPPSEVILSTYSCFHGGDKAGSNFNGSLYITSSYVCFDTVLFGDNRVKIPVSAIKDVKKKGLASLEVLMKDGTRESFSWFVSRSSAYHAVCARAGLEKESKKSRRRSRELDASSALSDSGGARKSAAAPTTPTTAAPRTPVLMSPALAELERTRLEAEAERARSPDLASSSSSNEGDSSGRLRPLRKGKSSRHSRTRSVDESASLVLGSSSPMSCTLPGETPPSLKKEKRHSRRHSISEAVTSLLSSERGGGTEVPSTLSQGGGAVGGGGGGGGGGDDASTSKHAAKDKEKAAKEELKKAEKQRKKAERLCAKFHIPYTTEQQYVGSYSCAYDVSGLNHGKLYVMSGFVLFKEIVAMMPRKITVPLAEVAKLEKVNTAGLVRTAIDVTTSDGKKHSFTGFASRDDAFDDIDRQWRSVLAKAGSASNTHMTAAFVRKHRRQKSVA